MQSEILLNLDSYLPRLHRSLQGKYTGGEKVSLRADNLCELPWSEARSGRKGRKGEASALGPGSAERDSELGRGCPVNNREATGQVVVRQCARGRTYGM